MSCGDWCTVKLNDLGEVNRGRSRHRPRHDHILYGGKYPFIQTADIKESGGRITKYQQTYNERGLAQSRLWPIGTMCITIAANIAETGILMLPACFPDSVIGFIANEDRCDVWFVEYVFRNLKRQIQHIASDSGTVQDNINLAFLEQLRFSIPRDVGEQRAIARVLGALDRKIDLNREMNRTLGTMAQALFRSWFVDFEPVSAKQEGRKPIGMDDTTASLLPDHFQETDVGPIPKRWKVGSSADIARYVNGKNFTKNATRTGRMVIRIAELNSGPAGSTIYNDVKADGENTAFPGDLLFSWSGSLDVYRWHRDEALVNQHIFKLICDKYPQWFVHFHLQEAMSFFQGIASGKATTMGHIKREHLSQFDIVLPPTDFMRAANRIIQPIYERMYINERQILSLAALRDTLLPKLLSGELRVGHAESIVEEV